MSYPYQELTYAALGGLDSLDNAAAIPHSKSDEGWEGIHHFAQATNVFAPTKRRDIQTRPGMADVRSTAINAAGIFTGMIDQGDIGSNRFLMTVSIAAGSHNIYEDVANPPTAIAGGTNFTIGADNLVSMANFHNGTNRGTIICSRSQDTPQFIVGSSGARSNLSITGTTLPKYVEVFGQRAIYGYVTTAGTSHPQRVYWSDIRNGSSITDVITQFESFETEQGGDITAIKKLSDICMVGLMNNVFLLAVTPAFSKPFAVRELPAGRYKGPVSHQGVVEADNALWWIGQTGIHSLDLTGKIRDWADIIKPTITGLKDSRRAYAIAGYDADRDLVVFAVTDGSDTKNQDVIALNIKTGAIYLWTISVNAMAQRMVSGENRLIMGGYVGKFRNWASGTAGDLDDATALIDADIITPRYHLGRPDWVKLFAGFKITFKPQNTSEDVILQYRMDDASSWTSFASSPYSVTGTAFDVDTKYFPLMKAGTHCQLRIREATLDHVMNIQSITPVFKFLHPGLNN